MPSLVDELVEGAIYEISVKINLTEFLKVNEVKVRFLYICNNFNHIVIVETKENNNNDDDNDIIIATKSETKKTIKEKVAIKHTRKKLITYMTNFIKFVLSLVYIYILYAST